MAGTTTRTPMPVKMRAKQFAMFDALKGLTEAIAEKERQYHLKRELSEDRIEELNRKLTMLRTGDIVTVIYYCQYGKTYRQLTGAVNKIDLFWKELLIDQISIGFSEILDLQ